ncbi:DUF4186 domain-containing protein [Kalamiella sp. sgz302252]|uniref:DUF4186 domain-containing protein n=1 Tax=Pantoea sp. sgz302252 TaxID=3341827 RepID=UPI0036D2A148
MSAIDDLFSRLSRSPFRQKFHLGHGEYAYCAEKGEEKISAHAADFVRDRLSAAQPANDGKQTPMRGHPVFIAQHATATCCRGCLSKWHHIPLHQPLTAEQQAWIVTVILHWLRLEMQRPQPPARKGKKKALDDNQLSLL